MSSDASFEISAELNSIDKGSHRNEWKINLAEYHPIQVGGEGLKGLTKMRIGSKFVDVFIKEIENPEEQKMKRSALEVRGIPTTRLFRIFEYSNSNKKVVISEDLSDEGKNWVVSENNTKVLDSKEYWKSVLRLTPEEKDGILLAALNIAVKAGERDSDGNSLSFVQPDRPTYPLTLVLPKQEQLINSERVLCTDLGVDLTLTDKKEERQVIQENIRRTYDFLFSTLGIFQPIPQDHAAYEYIDTYSAAEWNSLFGQEKYFKMRLEALGVEIKH